MKTHIITIAIGCILIVGCQRLWYLSLTDLSDPSHPHFCVGRHKSCKGKGIDFSFLDNFILLRVCFTWVSMFMLQCKNREF